ncbi:MAG TPA: hypothetical protein VNF69_11460 [Burkholderiales bacterium]|nr:hypothetical protein [Burkholderiales bacterium]
MKALSKFMPFPIRRQLEASALRVAAVLLWFRKLLHQLQRDRISAAEMKALARLATAQRDQALAARRRTGAGETGAVEDERDPWR